MRDHPVPGLKIFPGFGKNLSLTRMIGTDYVHHSTCRLRRVRLEILDKFPLGLPRPHNQNFPCSLQGGGQLLIEGFDMVVGWMFELPGPRLTLKIGEVNNNGMMAIEPDGGMLQCHDFLLFSYDTYVSMAAL